MAIPTSRTAEKGRIQIDFDKCTACRLCTIVCKDLTLQMKDGKVAIDENPLFGCYACGHCVAICPENCIILEGREATMGDFFEIPARDKMAQYDQLLNLMYGRRSVREFKQKDVEDDVIEKIINAASTAPMGIPPSDVQVLILKGNEKVQEFARDYIEYLSKIKWMFSPFMVAMMKPFLSKGDYLLFRKFLQPMIDFFIKSRKKEEDWLFYNAPLVMYFHGTDYTDPADAEIAATYAMLAAESLGLGSCMIGSIGPFIKNGATKLKKKFGIYPDNRSGIFIIFGYSKYQFNKSIKRTFAKINYY
jgi:nitroreductase/Pyruvate/2-oxoacid:ferredoxin oxidoreductase delta subunit